MTEPKWTQGPWVVVGEYYDIYAKDENNYANNYICQSSKSQGVRRKANAQLIAAAPDLYAALEMVSGMDLHHEILAIVDASMRKARGE